MSETTIIWLFGVIGAWNVVLTIGIFKLFLSQVETKTLISIMSKKAAEILHDSDNKFGLDDLLEKYVSRHYELSIEEWNVLLRKCEAIEAELANKKQERLLAAIISSTCRHKLKLPWQPVSIK